MCKDLGLTNEQAFDLAQAFTADADYFQFYQMFDCVLEKLKLMSAKEAFLQSLDLAPASYRENIEKALSAIDTLTFIRNHSGTACHIFHAVPLIIQIIVHSDTFEEAVMLNTKIGGASSDCGMLMGAFMQQISGIPVSWESKTTLRQH